MALDELPTKMCRDLYVYSAYLSMNIPDSTPAGYKRLMTGAPFTYMD